MFKQGSEHRPIEGSAVWWMSSASVSHSLSRVIYRAICAVRGSLSIPLCWTLCWAHTAFTDTHTLTGSSFMNVYNKLMVDCKKNMMCMSFFPDFFQYYRRLLCFFLYGSSLIHISAGHSHTCLTAGFWIAGKSLTHENLFSDTSLNPVAPPLPLPHVVLESGPTILHRMPPALKWSALILFILIFDTGTPWHFFPVARWPHAKLSSHSLSSA